jgi:hypothetical protein
MQVEPTTFGQQLARSGALHVECDKAITQIDEYQAGFREIRLETATEA